jgi:hypothetical protein
MSVPIAGRTNPISERLADFTSQSADPEQAESHQVAIVRCNGTSSAQSLRQSSFYEVSLANSGIKKPGSPYHRIASGRCLGSMPREFGGTTRSVVPNIYVRIN